METKYLSSMIYEFIQMQNQIYSSTLIGSSSRTEITDLKEKPAAVLTSNYIYTLIMMSDRPSGVGRSQSN